MALMELSLGYQKGAEKLHAILNYPFIFVVLRLENSISITSARKKNPSFNYQDVELKFVQSRNLCLLI